MSCQVSNLKFRGIQLQKSQECEVQLVEEDVNIDLIDI